MRAKAARGGCGRRGKEVMCGIVGFASKKADYDKQAVLKEMMDRMTSPKTAAPRNCGK